jgi:hypothetical protein
MSMSTVMVRHPVHPDPQATHMGGEAVGTIFALPRGDDAEDERLIRALGKVVPLGQTPASIDGLKIEISNAGEEPGSLNQKRL